ncbi:MAG TPA: SIMPL domain-containing protein [Luteibaculaceae bacterium]|nr:SIMPL domain-containing protein [Luteibaculaceae bacterium]
MSQITSIGSSIAIGAALVVSAFLVGNSLQKFRNDDRSISVKGFSEREVKADLAVWKIKIALPTNDLIKGNDSLQILKKKVKDFLLAKGMEPDEIKSLDYAVVDKQANEYGEGSDRKLRYLLSENLEVRTAKVDRILEISRLSSELVGAGVALSTRADWQGAGLQFFFTQLQSIKPVMISEAIKNAKSAAQQFAKDSDIGLGPLRRANQGLFSIEDRDQSFEQGNPNGYGASVNTGLFKKVRVVISAEYSIE